MINNQKYQYTALIKKTAKTIGFDFCGIAKADFLEKEAPKLEKWLQNKMQGEMHYMAKHFDKRLDPRKLVEGAKSVVSLLYNYYPQKIILEEEDNYKVSKYAYGQDYHKVIKNKLKHFFQILQQEIGEVGGRFFVDSAPVMDKVWAEKAGIGWIGKHTNLITREKGSFLFIAELILDIELEYDKPIKDYCGTCTRCIEACPTDAIVAPYWVDGSKCISYFTIELKEEIPLTYKGKFENWIFGCDICQDVCPWNRFSEPHKEEAFMPNPDLEKFEKKDWEEITEEIFEEVFKKTAVKRAKYKGLKRNIQFVSSPLKS